MSEWLSTDDLMVKEEALKSFLLKLYRQEGGLALAYSGGVDSSYLLYILSTLSGIKFGAYYADSSLDDKHALEEAEEFCRDLGVTLHKIKVNALASEAITRNHPDRCFQCKSLLFATIQEQAGRDGLKAVIDGTNHDDLYVYRPGLQALRKLKVSSPLALCGFSKDAIRALSAIHRLKSASKPSSPCLASRVDYYQQFDADLLHRIHRAENFLSEQGFSVVRVRVHGPDARLARIEVLHSELPKAFSLSMKINEVLTSLGFEYACIDLKGYRSGSFDKGLKPLYEIPFKPYEPLNHPLYEQYHD